MAARYPHLERVIVSCVDNFGKILIIYGLSNGFSVAESRKIRLKFKQEAFADRTYQHDGSLTLLKRLFLLIFSNNNLH